MTYRIGLGYDVHRFARDRPLFLGGVEILHEQGLEGHSDADVVLHAIGDALLGAAGDGDLGTHFPPHEESFRNIRSTVLIDRIMERLWRRQLLVVNIDTVVTAQNPQLAPHRERIVASIAALLAIDPSAVSVKATTSEGMGFEGRREGISARAVVLLREAGPDEAGTR